MRKFQIWWLKLCCFLTGYNYYILSNCSEVSTRKVKKYTAALLIVSTVWAFVGYCFCDRYIKLGVMGSVLGSIIAIFLIIQIERQILLVDKATRILRITRFGLAILMAIIGSLIIDQMIFKDDIEKNKLESNQKQVNDLMPKQTVTLNKQIADLSSDLKKKELERVLLQDDINRNPTQQRVELTSKVVPITTKTTDSNKNLSEQTTLKSTISKTFTEVPNPKIDQLPSIDKQIYDLRNQKLQSENRLFTVRADLEKIVSSKIGFIDELTIMTNILKKSLVAAIVYCIWFLFLLLIELLILIGKSYDAESDYDKTIRKQMDIHLKKIELL